MSAKWRHRLERLIARRVILDAIRAGYALNVNNGGGTNELPAPSIKVREILSVMFATDDEELLFYRDGRCVGWVLLIYGNAESVVSDYTTNLDVVMLGASKLADIYS